jgi:hypothetical protein
MRPVIDQLLLPPKLVARALADLSRIAVAAQSVGALADEFRRHIGPAIAQLGYAVSTLDYMREELGSLQRALDPMSEDLDGLRKAFLGSNEELEQLRRAITPELKGVREAAEPLYPTRSCCLHFTQGAVLLVRASCAGEVGSVHREDHDHGVIGGRLV